MSKTTRSSSLPTPQELQNTNGRRIHSQRESIHAQRWVVEAKNQCTHETYRTMNLNRSLVSYGGWREGGRGGKEGGGKITAKFLGDWLLLKVGRENATSVQGKKKIAAGENLERTRRIELLESSILDQQEKELLATKARNKRRGYCWYSRKKLQQQVVMSTERKERAFVCGLHCCWFSSSSSSEDDDDDDDDDDDEDEEGGIQSRTAAAFSARIRARI